MKIEDKIYQAMVMPSAKTEWMLGITTLLAALALSTALISLYSHNHELKNVFTNIDKGYTTLLASMGGALLGVDLIFITLLNKMNPRSKLLNANGGIYLKQRENSPLSPYGYPGRGDIVVVPRENNLFSYAIVLGIKNENTLDCIILEEEEAGRPKLSSSNFKMEEIYSAGNNCGAPQFIPNQ